MTKELLLIGAGLVILIIIVAYWLGDVITKLMGSGK